MCIRNRLLIYIIYKLIVSNNTWLIMRK
ncbi:hypothetical protein [Escherichia coli]